MADFSKTRNILKICTLYTARVYNACLPHHPCPGGGSNSGPTSPEASALPLCYRPPFKLSFRSLSFWPFNFTYRSSLKSTLLSFPCLPRHLPKTQPSFLFLPILVENTRHVLSPLALHTFEFYITNYYKYYFYLPYHAMKPYLCPLFCFRISRNIFN